MMHTQICAIHKFTGAGVADNMNIYMKVLRIVNGIMGLLYVFAGDYDCAVV